MSDLGEPSGSVLPAAPPPSSRNRRTTIAVLAGAVVAAVVVAVVLVLVFRPASSTGTPAAQAVTPTASSPAGSATASPTSSPTAAGTTTGTRSGTTAAGTPSPTGTPGRTTAPPRSTAPAGSYVPPPHVASVSLIGPMAATGIVTGKGIDVPGTVEQAVQWQDRNGRNILLAARRIDHNRADGGPDAGAIVVMLVSHLDGKGKVERTITEAFATPTDPCRFEFGFQVLPGSLTVRDDDNDGIGEATAAWWGACLGGADRYDARVALLSGSREYLLRGRGLPRVGPSAVTSRGGLPKASFTASPGRSAWPANSYPRASALARSLFL